MHQNDWFMRQVDLGAAALAHVIFNRKPAYEIIHLTQYTATDLLYVGLMTLVAEGKLSEAEDLLFASLDTHDIDYLLTALDFYARLGECEDAYLDQCNFPREEIEAGLLEMKRLFGVVVEVA